MARTSVRADGDPVVKAAPSTGITRLRSAFRPDRRSVVAYVPMGDPGAGDDRILDTYRDAGVAVLEVGVPARDPWLDGAEVRDSMHRALDAGVDPYAVAERLARWRSSVSAAVATDASPVIVWFSYPDLPLAAVERAARLGVIDALLMLEPWRHPEADRLPGLLARLGIGACAFLPWDPADADLRAASAATGYVMVQARPGTTGADTDPGVPTAQVQHARRLAPGLPVVAGFGVHDAATTRAVLRSGADGVVVGSACIRAAREGGARGLDALLREIAAGAAGVAAGAAAGAKARAAGVAGVETRA